MKTSPRKLLNILGAGMLCLSGFQAAAQTPPETWQEHWFEHDQLLERWYYTDDIAIYFDPNSTTAQRNTATEWIAPFLTDAWNHTRTSYELGGPEQRLYGIFHKDIYGGGHPDTYFFSKHDYRNVVDIASQLDNTWQRKHLILHEIAHIVESSAHDVMGPNPSSSQWKDSHFDSIFNYDVAVAIGDTTLAQSFYNTYDNEVASYPVAGTRWFRNWFYPLWNNRGKTRFLQRYFHCLAYNFPTQLLSSGRRNFSRTSMNVGEFVYFMSAAARRDMRDQATIAFTWSSQWDAEYEQARIDFPEIDPAKPWFMLVNQNSGKSVDLISGDMSDGAVVNQWAYDYNTGNQRWRLLPTENGDHFKIVSWASDKVLGIAGNSTASGGQLVSDDYVPGNASQQWDLVHVGEGWYKIVNVNSGKVLDVSGASTANGAKLQQWTDNGTGAQKFRFQPVGDYFIQTLADGKYLAVQGSVDANGTAIVQSPWQNISSFKWRFLSNSEGWLQVPNLLNLNRTITIEGGSLSSGADALFWDYNASYQSEKIQILPLLNGKFKFYFRHSGMAWNIPGGSSADNVQMDQAADSSYNRQQFRLERVP